MILGLFGNVFAAFIRFRVPSTFTLCANSGFFSLKGGMMPARWIMQSIPLTAFFKSFLSSISPQIVLNCHFLNNSVHDFLLGEFCKSKHVTSCSRARSCFRVFCPTFPKAPVNRIFCFILNSLF